MVDFEVQYLSSVFDINLSDLLENEGVELVVVGAPVKANKWNAGGVYHKDEQVIIILHRDDPLNQTPCTTFWGTFGHELIHFVSMNVLGQTSEQNVSHAIPSLFWGYPESASWTVQGNMQRATRIQCGEGDEE